MIRSRRRIAVYGSSTVGPEDPEYGLAYELGGALARAGAEVMTGGYGGIMEACSRGASEAEGYVVGVTVEMFEARGPANAWVKDRLHTPDLFERLRVLVNEADGFVAVSGSLGTLTEVFLTWTLLSVRGRPEAPLVLLGKRWRAFLESHRRLAMIPADAYRHVHVVASVPEATRLVLPEVPAQ